MDASQKPTIIKLQKVMWEDNDVPKIMKEVLQNKIQRNGLSKKNYLLHLKLKSTSKKYPLTSK